MNFYKTTAIAILLTLSLLHRPAAAANEIQPDSIDNDTHENQQKNTLYPDTKNSTRIIPALTPKEKITALIANHCTLPEKNELLKVDADAENTITDIINDETIIDSVRMRAIQLLTYFPTDNNEQQLIHILNDPAATRRIKIRTITTYAEINPQQAPLLLKKLLADPDNALKFVTIVTLQRTNSQTALNALKEGIQNENNKLFLKYLNRAVNNHPLNTTK